MIRLFTLVLGCLFFIPLQAQSFLKKINVQAPSTTILGQEVPQTEAREVLFAEAVTDGGLLVFSAYEAISNNHSRSLAIQKLSEKGEVEWAKAYPYLSLFSHEPLPTVAIQATADGGFVGVFQGDGWSSQRLVRFNVSGEILWTKDIRRQQNSYEYYTTPYGVTGLANGDILFITGQGHSAYFLITLLDGTTGTAKSSFRMQTSVAMQITEIKATDDGGALIVGALGNSFNNRDLIIIKWGAEHAISWVRRLNEPEDIVGLAAYEYDNSYLVFSRINKAIAVFKLDPETGNDIWSKAFLPEIGASQHEPLQALNRYGDQVFFSGLGFDDFTTDQVALLSQFDLSKGSFDWMARNTDNEGGFIYERYAQLEEEGLLTVRGVNSIYLQRYNMDNGQPSSCSGNTYQPLSFQLIEGDVSFTNWPVTLFEDDWAVLFNRNTSYEVYTCQEDLLCEDRDPLELAEQVTIAPNPTANFVRIALPGYHDLELTLTLYDVAGRVIQQQTSWVDGVLDYDMSTLPAGTYYLQFQTNNDIFGKQIVKITP